MGGKHPKRRHPGLLYFAGITLTAVIFSGCVMLDMFSSRQSPEDMLLNQQITDYEKQIKQNAFKEATLTNKEVLETLTSQPPDTPYSKDMLLQQARAAQVLLDQIRNEQTQIKALTEQMQKTRTQLKYKEQSVESLKTLIKNLNKTIQTLENQTTQLEKQIERMKQIDLK